MASTFLLKKKTKWLTKSNIATNLICFRKESGFVSILLYVFNQPELYSWVSKKLRAGGHLIRRKRTLTF